MGVSCIVESIAGKMGLVGDQNVTNHMGVSINPTAQFQPATHVRRLKVLNPIYGIVIILMELSKATTDIVFP
jgi:hypothetical protein